MVRPKKFLGQHFLKDQNIAGRIVDSLKINPANIILEIGPGMGVLTQFLVKKENASLYLSEIDRESIAYLKDHFPLLKDRILEGDFLQMDLNDKFKNDIDIIGNFPYNISSQIFFKVLDHRNQVMQVVCMLQKEVADRLAAQHGNKTYGILSVLLQAYYDIEYLFKVPPGVFFPPPKVMSAVIRLKRNTRTELGCDEVLFKKLVKQGFNNRRKTLRNALKSLNLPAQFLTHPLLDKRAEQLAVSDFIFLTQSVEQSGYAIR